MLRGCLLVCWAAGDYGMYGNTGGYGMDGFYGGTGRCAMLCQAQPSFRPHPVSAGPQRRVSSCSAATLLLWL